MKIAIYPGTFNPWHAGHQDVLDKALKVFDKVIVARGINTEKFNILDPISPFDNDRVEISYFSGLLVDEIVEKGAVAVIKGLRGEQDLRYEITQQYWNEDLNITVPTFYIVCDRNLVHISSSAIRQVNKMKERV